MRFRDIDVPRRRCFGATSFLVSHTSKLRDSVFQRFDISMFRNFEISISLDFDILTSDISGFPVLRFRCMWFLGFLVSIFRPPPPVGSS